MIYFCIYMILNVIITFALIFTNNLFNSTDNFLVNTILFIDMLFVGTPLFVYALIVCARKRGAE